MASLIPGEAAMAVGGMINLQGIMYWVGYGFLIVFLLAGLWVVFYLTSFPIKATVFQIYGSGKDGVFAFSKSKNNRVRWNKKRTAWQPMLPLFNKKQVQPFDTEYLYPGKRIYVFELNGEWMPGRVNISKTTSEGKDIPEEEQASIEAEIKSYLKRKVKTKWIPGKVNINQTEDQIRCEINPVPYTVREWQSIEYKRNAIEYAEHNFWNDNRSLIVFLICAALILGAGLLFVWMSYKLAGAGRQDISNLVQALNDVGRIKGAPPG